MIAHYLTIAIRNLSKQKMLALINILGLSIGLACFSLFMLYALNEFSYDHFHKNGKQIFRVNQWYSSSDGGESGTAETPLALGPTMKRDFPDLENFVRIQGGGSHLIRIHNQLSRSNLLFADPQIFSVFSFPLVSGNPTTVLQDPHSIVITREKAMQLFGGINVVGKRVEINLDDGYQPFLIAGVAEDMPQNSTIRFEILGNLDFLAATSLGMEAAENWHMTIGLQTFAMLRKGSGLMHEPGRLLEIRQKYLPDERTDPKAVQFKSMFLLQPITGMHTSVQLDAGPPGTTTDPKNIWILISIAAAVLLIACINFTTLAIGRSASRAKEVGLRKVIGGRRSQLVYQFLTESLLLTLFSAILGLLIADLLLPYFNRLSGKDLVFSFTRFPQLAWFLALLILVVGLLAGSYPALVLSRFRPVEVLKNRIRLGGANFFTKSLVTFQFILSTGLIIATCIILQQLSYMRSRDLGFAKENVVVVNVSGLDTKKIYPLFRHDMQLQPEVLGVAGEAIGLGEGQGQMGGGYNINGKNCFALEYPIDPDYLKVMGMKLVAGRNFDPTIASDTVNSVIVNETLVKTVFGSTPEKVLTQQFKDIPDGRSQVKIIIGVVKDFNFEPLTRAVRPQLFSQQTDFPIEKFLVRVRQGDPSEAISKMQSSWKKLVGGLPFSYSFLDEDMNRFYKSEQRWSSVVGCAAGISIFLASLGLFGLTALAAVNRTKEVGIRKVLGASARAIIGLLSKEFLKLVGLAFLIASPLVWYFMHKWLQNYAYRIPINGWIFAATAFAALWIAFLTTSYHALRAAQSNPVNSLRTE